MDGQTVVSRADEQMSANVDDEVVILNLSRDNYVGLDVIGRRIWELLEEPIRVDTLCEQLRAEFDAPKEQISGDVLSFLRELADEGLLRILDHND